MAGYKIKSLNEWAPDGPVYSCPYIDDAIGCMEKVRDINDDLRSSLEQAINLIETLDDMIIELQAENDKLAKEVASNEH